ncbi:kynureninase [Labedaea rhizosphaerae]|uniref:kynureninase/PvdN C-terminal domain-containing protein n=1 Tax=Labedaea rhizosphaerae TaxID=598644 RepID=UPI003C79E028
MPASSLAAHYSRFRVGERLLLTGHSHQAWPDVALEGQVEAFEDASRAVDEKWSLAFAKADRVRAGFRSWLADDGAMALGANTHELVLRMLSAVDLRARPRLVTTDGEFHTLRRQLTRLEEAGVEVVRVAASPADTLAGRVASVVDSRTAAVLVSAVLFETSRIVPGLAEVASTCALHGAEFVVDVYHALGVMEFPLAAHGLTDAWVVGGGYKYLQLGEGNCFLRLPAHADTLRPVITGWYAEFGALAAPPQPGQVAYGTGGDRFAGSTYDPTSHYRAARVFDFFAAQGMTPAALRERYLAQTSLLANEIAALGLDVATDRANFGGFVSVRTPDAGRFQEALAQRGVLTDARGPHLRFGVAPYLTDDQLRSAVAELASIATQKSVS